GASRVFLSWSDDHGNNWSEPRVVDDIPSVASKTRDTQAFHSGIAVTPTGTIGLMWSEFGGRCWRISISYDGARFFTSSTSLNPCVRANVNDAILTRYLTSAARAVDWDAVAAGSNETA